MESVAIYLMLFISIYILYLTIKYKTTKCYYPEDSSENLEKPPIKISEIFQGMFQDPEPRPGRNPL
jgi:hypothetical protein